MTHGTLADRIDARRERAGRERTRAALYAGFTVLLAAGELDAELGHDVKSAALNNISKIILAICGAGTAYASVSWGLDSVQTGRETAVLIAEQAREESGARA
jgi:hypothetical protein